MKDTENSPISATSAIIELDSCQVDLIFQQIHRLSVKSKEITSEMKFCNLNKTVSIYELKARKIT